MDTAQVEAGPQTGQFQGFGRGGLAAARLLEERRRQQIQSQGTTRREARVPREQLAHGVELQRGGRK